MSPWTNISRRSFLHSSAFAALGAIAARPAQGQAAGGLQILEPMNGAVMHARLGREVPGGLEVEISGRAPQGAEVLVQGRPASRDGETFRGAAVLRERETEVVATARSGSDRQEAKVRLVWDRHSQKRYRFVIDDNSFFLRDITQKGYKSLFECFYLKMLKDLNAKHGARFTLNIYYTTGDDWNLKQFPDQYRSEWEANANWLRLAFHAYANEPNLPYQDAPVEKLLADLDLINAQIHRIAGPKTFSPVAVVHWGMTRPEAWKPLYERGSRVLGGYFRKSAQGQWQVNYRMDDIRSEWLSRHDLLKDFASGMIFLQGGHGGQQHAAGQDRAHAGSGGGRSASGGNHRSAHPRAVLLAVLPGVSAGPCRTSGPGDRVSDPARLQAGVLAGRLLGRSGVIGPRGR